MNPRLSSPRQLRDTAGFPPVVLRFAVSDMSAGCNRVGPRYRVRPGDDVGRREECVLTGVTGESENTHYYIQTKMEFCLPSHKVVSKDFKNEKELDSINDMFFRLTFLFLFFFFKFSYFNIISDLGSNLTLVVWEH